MENGTKTNGNSRFTCNGLTEHEELINGLIDPDAPTAPQFSYSAETQRRILASLLHDAELMRQASPVIEYGYWTDEAWQLTYKVAQEYHAKYGTLADEWQLVQAIADNVTGKPEKIQNRYQHEFAQVYHYYKPGVIPRQAIVDGVANFATVQRTKAAVHSFLDEHKKSGKLEIAKLAARMEEIRALGSADGSEALDLLAYRDHAKAKQRYFVVDQWFPSGSLVVLSGLPKLGKSTLVFSLVGSILTGNPWLERFDVRQSPVVYLDYENPADYVWSNLAEYLPEDLTPFSSLFMAPKKLPAAVTGEWLRSFVAKHDKGKPGVVFIDSGRAAFGSLFADVPNWENTQGPVRSALEPLQRFAQETGWLVCIVHHDNKGGKYSGSSDWAGVPDYPYHFAAMAGDRRRLQADGRLIDKPADLVLCKQGRRIVCGGTVAESIDEVHEIQHETGERLIMDLLPVVTRDDVTPDIGLTIDQLKERSGLSDWIVRRCVKHLLTADVETGHRISCAPVKTDKPGRRPEIYFREPICLGLSQRIE